MESFETNVNKNSKRTCNVHENSYDLYSYNTIYMRIKECKIDLIIMFVMYISFRHFSCLNFKLSVLNLVQASYHHYFLDPNIFRRLHSSLGKVLALTTESYLL